MPWPLSRDYNEAIQSPQSSFADPDLRAGQPVLNALGLPLPRTGNFADVYEFQGAAGNKWANDHPGTGGVGFQPVDRLISPGDIAGARRVELHAVG